MTNPFVHLHVHTEYSLLDGATRVKDLVHRCVELGMPAVAVTDHGNMYCAWNFYHTAMDAGIKPILGCELYVCDDLTQKSSAKREYHHLVLLAKDNEGYKNLIKLSSIGFVDGFYYKPRIDFATLKQHAKGLICLSACIAGELPTLLLMERHDQARQLVKQYLDLFGEDYYIELQDHQIQEERQVMPQLIKLAKEFGIPLVVTNDVHYLNKEDAEVQDMMLCVQTASYYDEPNRMRFFGDSFYLKTYDEMAQLFPDLPEVLENTVKIAEKCNVTLGREKLLPKYVPADGSKAEDFLWNLIQNGLKKRKMEATEEVVQRIKYEFGVITSMGFVDYFLIVWDFINYAKTNGIAVGPGRGSGAGSLVAYLIEITEVPPLKYHLYFERFLNPQRKTMPDFDIDFCSERRQEVIDYVHEKYGHDNVAQIVTFGTMAAKNAIKDVARAMRVSIAEANRLSGYVPKMGKHTIKQLLGKAPYKPDTPPVISDELIEAYDNPSTHKLLDLAMRLEGSPRQTGMHAAGVVICSDAIRNHVPLQTNNDVVTTQFNMKEVEEAGLLKMDFLGLTNLTDIQKAINYVKAIHNVEIDFSNHGYDDLEVFKTIGSGDTMCIFQLEGAGMRDMMKSLQPKSMEDVSAGISLYRPGPMQYVGQFLECSKDKSKISYDHEKLQPILEVTNGCIVYQEQVMQIVQQLAGFSLALADNVRYAMSKKKYAMMEDLRKYFIHGGTTSTGEKVKGCVANGIDQDTANKIYDRLIEFSAYAFNKAHATSYSYVTYQTAYLKTYYPVEFLCAMLNNRITNADDVKKYINYALSKGIKVLPPDVNKSFALFRVEDGGLRFGLAGVKSIGLGIIDDVVSVRKQKGEFASMEDLFEKTWQFLNKRLIENLIKAGAFDCFGRTRADMLNTYGESLTPIVDSAKNRASGQLSLFDMMPELNFTTVRKNNIAEFEKQQLYAYEKEALGFYFSGSPLDDYDKHNKTYSFNFDTSLLPSEDDDDHDQDFETPLLAKRFVTCGGLLREVRHLKSKEGKSLCFAQLEDKWGMVELGMFEPSLSKFKHLIAEDTFVVLRGMLNPTTGGYRINVREIVDLQKPVDVVQETQQEVVQEEPTTTLWLKMEKDDELFQRVVEVLKDYPGKLSVNIKINGRAYKLGEKVRRCIGIENELKSLLGDQNVVFFQNKKI